MKEIIRDKTKELLEYIKDSVDKGYNIYSNIDEIFELIDTIVNWYIFKYSENKIIMSVISTKDYFKVKEGISNIDSNAFFLVTDAYEVSGGEQRGGIMEFIRFKNVKKTYKNGVTAVYDLDLKIIQE